VVGETISKHQAICHQVWCVHNNKKASDEMIDTLAYENTPTRDTMGSGHGARRRNEKASENDKSTAPSTIFIFLSAGVPRQASRYTHEGFDIGDELYPTKGGRLSLPESISAVELNHSVALDRARSQPWFSDGEWRRSILSVR